MQTSNHYDTVKVAALGRSESVVSARVDNHFVAALQRGYDSTRFVGIR
jgi:hypothetical protein